MKRSLQVLLAVVAGTVARVSAAADGTETVEDVRVEPLLETRWSQSGDLSETSGGEPCYNCYTPGNALCGCVATAMAQIMRHHRFPAEPVEPGTYACGVFKGREKTDGRGYRPVYEHVDLTMQGGLYQWDDMPPVPSEGTTPAQRQAIGKLTSDVGIACRTVYGEDESGARGRLASVALTERFGYGGAVAAAGDLLAPAFVRRVLVSNLEAGLPVFVGVKGKRGAHAVVADGYGYSQGTLRVHYNLGQGGRGDGWYVPSAVAEYDTIQNLVYNISPSGDQPASVVSPASAEVQTAFVGVRLDAQVVSDVSSSAKLSAKGLPRGLRLVDGRLAGVPTAAGTSVATFTADGASGVQSWKVTFDVRPLADWAKGSFDGGVEGPDGAVCGLVSLKASATGRLSGTFGDRGTNWTVAAASFDAYDSERSAYVADVAARCTVAGKKSSRIIRVEVRENEIGAGELVGAVSADGTTLRAWQNLWSGAYRAVGKEVFRTGKRSGRTYSFGGGTCGLSEDEELALAVTSAGKVKATGRFPREIVKTDSRGRTTVRSVAYRPTCSTVVVPTTAAEEGGASFAGVVYVSFPPSEKNGFSGYAACVPLRSAH